jgi:uncharacterized protein (DUF1697 family)
VTRVAALLQGVNLAANRRVPMPALRQRLEELGYEEVSTYLASGNVILTSKASPAKLERDLKKHVSDWTRVEIPVLVRTHAELAKVAERDPLGSSVDDPARYQVTFLSAPPKAEAVRELEAASVAPEEVAVHGREIYAWHPNGVGRSKLAALLTARRLGVMVTARNWNTVTKLVELTRENS